MLKILYIGIGILVLVKLYSEAACASIAGQCKHKLFGPGRLRAQLVVCDYRYAVCHPIIVRWCIENIKILDNTILDK